MRIGRGRRTTVRGYLYEVSFSGGPCSLRQGRIDSVGVIGGDSLDGLFILRAAYLFPSSSFQTGK